MQDARLAAIGRLNAPAVTPLLLYPQRPIVAGVERDGGWRLEGKLSQAPLAPIVQYPVRARQFVPHEGVLRHDMQTDASTHTRTHARTHILSISLQPRNLRLSRHLRLLRTATVTNCGEEQRAQRSRGHTGADKGAEGIQEERALRGRYYSPL